MEKHACKHCEIENEQEWKRIENMFRDRLSDRNKITFDALEVEVRRGIIVQAMDEKVIELKPRSR